MNRKHRRTLEKPFEEPARADVAWRDVEAPLIAVGAEVSQGGGSRVRVALNAVRAVFHEPHPRKEISKAAVRDIKEFLEAAGVRPS